MIREVRMRLQERWQVAEWVVGAREGREQDRDALARFYRERLGRFFGKRLNDPHLAEDMVQETLLLGLTGLRRLRDPFCFDAFICRIGRRVAINAFRDRRPLACDPRFLTQLEEAGACTPVTPPSAPPSLAGEAVNAALRNLEPEEVLLIREHHAEGLPLASIAPRLGIKVSALKMRLLRARRRLRPILARFLAEESDMDAVYRLSGRKRGPARERLPGVLGSRR